MADRERSRRRQAADAPPTGARGAGRIAGVVGLVGIVGVVVAVAVGALLLFVRGCSFDLGIGGDVGPGDGTESMRLPVVVTPATDLRPDQVVQVRSQAFDADEIVGITQCLPAADTDDAGVDACDTDGGSRFAVGPDGVLDVPWTVRRIITVDGEAHDCATVEGGCLVVAADASDFDRSGGQRITFAEGLGPAVPVADVGRPQTLRLPVTTDPAPPFTDGQVVSIRAEGFVADEPILLAWCSADFERRGPLDTCEPEDVAQAVGPITGISVSGVTRRADGDGIVELTAAAKASVRPFAAGEIPVACTSDRPCLIVVAAAADTQRSAVVEYSITR